MVKPKDVHKINRRGHSEHLTVCVVVSLQEVNQMWAGLGYYSRGRRLHEGAQKVGLNVVMQNLDKI